MGVSMESGESKYSTRRRVGGRGTPGSIPTASTATQTKRKKANSLDSLFGFWQTRVFYCRAKEERDEKRREGGRRRGERVTRLA
jgi:hypothetical protein